MSTGKRSRVKKAASLTPPAAKPGNHYSHSDKPEGKTDNQRYLIEAIDENDVIIVEGPAGCGKTHIGVGCAVDYLKRGLVKKIYITKPLQEAGDDMGALPGTLEEKMQPALVCVMELMAKFLSQGEIEMLMKKKVIDVVSLNFMRGRTFDDAFIYADECQNATEKQLTMLLSRIGANSKLVIAGDSEQSDLPRQHADYYRDFVDGFYEEQMLESQADEHLNRVEVCFLDESDIQRNPIIGSLLKVLRKIKARRA